MFWNLAHAEYATTTAVTIIETAIADITDVLGEGLVVVFGLVGGLIGLFFMVKLVRKYISRGK